MSLNRLNELVSRAAKALYDNEKFAVGVLAVRVRKAAEVYPLDQTIINMSGFLNKRAASSKDLFITRAELKDVYNRLYSSNSKFPQLFHEELGLVAEAPRAKMARDANEGKNLVEGAFEKLADPVLSNALSNAFDKNATYKPYSNATAKSAQEHCAYELSKLGLSPKKIDVVAGQPDVLLCQATYDTPRGQSHVLIPVEIKNQKALLPTIFLSRAGFSDLATDALKDHLVSTAGKSYKIDVQQILQLVSTAKNGTTEVIGDVERAVMKFASTKETPATHTPNGILYQQVDQPILDVQETQYEQPAEVQAFAQRLSSAAGVAELTFSKNAVELGRKLIRHALSSWGYKNAQVAVADCNKNTIFYAVSVDETAGFKVPVKVEQGQIQEPSVVISVNGPGEFSVAGISEVLASGSLDPKVVALASPLYGSKPSDLIKQIVQAMSQHNYLKAEDALNVLRASGDEKAFQTGFDVYQKALKGEFTKEASADSKCNKQYKTAHSKYMICAHTNLPVHKVYQDKNGDCHPGYRKDMSETAEGGSFLYSKIYMG